MTLQQEIDLAASRAYEEGYKKASEEAEKKVQQAIENAEKGKQENARKMKAKNISDDIIAECTGLSLQQIQEL